MSNDELAQIEGRAAAATDGPWAVVGLGRDRRMVAPSSGPCAVSLMGAEQYYPWVPERIEDWQFIAHARADIPALIAEVRRLRATFCCADAADGQRCYCNCDD